MLIKDHTSFFQTLLNKVISISCIGLPFHLFLINFFAFSHNSKNLVLSNFQYLSKNFFLKNIIFLI